MGWDTFGDFGRSSIVTTLLYCVSALVHVSVTPSRHRKKFANINKGGRRPRGHFTRHARAYLFWEPPTRDIMSTRYMNRKRPKIKSYTGESNADRRTYRTSSFSLYVKERAACATELDKKQDQEHRHVLAIQEKNMHRRTASAPSRQPSHKMRKILHMYGYGKN